VCLVHCLALPFALTAVAGLGAAHHTFHLAAAALVLPLAVAAGWPGYKVHRRAHVLALFGLGALLIGGSLPVEELIGHDAVIGATMAGSLLLIAGHARNWTLRARCSAHVLPHHADHCEGEAA
jgi:hypothetical protein